MRPILLLSILAGVTLSMGGCRADSAPSASSPIDPSAGSAGRSSQPLSASDQPASSLRGRFADDRPLIVCFGDSLTAGYGADDGQSYPDFLQKDLDAAGYHYRVVNEGISGNTTKDGVDRLREIEQMKPAVVVLEFGGNDGLRGFKVESTRTNLGTMIAGLQSAGAKVVLAGITLPPDYGADYVNAFTRNYSALGRQYGVPVLPFLLKNVYGVSGLMQADNIHATDQGNEVVAHNVLPLVMPLLKK